MIDIRSKISQHPWRLAVKSRFRHAIPPHSVYVYMRWSPSQLINSGDVRFVWLGDGRRRRHFWRCWLINGVTNRIFKPGRFHKAAVQFPVAARLRRLDRPENHDVMQDTSRQLGNSLVRRVDGRR